MPDLYILDTRLCRPQTNATRQFESDVLDGLRTAIQANRQLHTSRLVFTLTDIAGGQATNPNRLLLISCKPQHTYEATAVALGI